MKTLLPKSGLTGAISLVAVFLGIVTVLLAAQRKQAHVTEVIRDVRLLNAQMASRAAVVNDAVNEGSAVRTGTDSRAELQFSDQTLTRLGANTVFSFGAGARTYDLGSGAILMTAPKNAGAVKISTAVATCAISGFTAILERHSNAWNKLIVLYGQGSLQINGLSGGPCHLHGGQMVVFPPKPNHYPPVLNIDLAKLLNGKLVKGFIRPLPELDLILAEIQNQQTSPPSGGLIDPTSQDTIDQAMNARPMETAPPRPTPIPTGRRF